MEKNSDKKPLGFKETVLAGVLVVVIVAALPTWLTTPRDSDRPIKTESPLPVSATYVTHVTNYVTPTISSLTATSTSIPANADYNSIKVPQSEQSITPPPVQHVEPLNAIATGISENYLAQSKIGENLSSEQRTVFSHTTVAKSEIDSPRPQLIVSRSVPAPGNKTPPLVELSISGVDYESVSDNVVYTITATNVSKMTIKNISVESNCDNYISIVSKSSELNEFTRTGIKNIRWIIKELKPGEVRTQSVVVTCNTVIKTSMRFRIYLADNRMENAFTINTKWGGTPP